MTSFSPSHLHDDHAVKVEGVENLRQVTLHQYARWEPLNTRMHKTYGKVSSTRFPFFTAETTWHFDALSSCVDDTDQQDFRFTVYNQQKQASKLLWLTQKSLIDKSARLGLGI